jgi:soluble lytic murein transglycosylase-like protein
MTSLANPDPVLTSALRHGRLALAAVLLTLGSAAAAGEIYKYTAEDGTVTYTYLKPHDRPYERLRHSCLLSYIGCEMSRADWSRVPLNHVAYRDQILAVAGRHGVDPALIRAVVHAESNFNLVAKSRAGAQGLMQLMPGTQKQYGVRNPYDASQNLDGGTRLFKTLMAKYRNDVKMAAAAYNAGEDAVARYNGIPPYEETRNYVRRVTTLYSRYQGND